MAGQAGRADRGAGAKSHFGDPTAKPSLGWREWLALPELEIPAIKAKVDTGARTSALHAFNLEAFLQDGASWVRFDVHPIQRDDATITRCLCRVHDHRWVTNSGGGREKRYVILTALRLGDAEWPVEVTLTDRDQMGFRMLLGRSAIKNRYLVDPGRSYCLGRRRRKKVRKKIRSAREDIAASSSPREERN